MIPIRQVMTMLGVIGVMISVTCCGSSPTGTDTLVPEAPLNLRVVGIAVGPEKTSITMRWEHPEDNGYPITRYQLRAYKGSNSCGENPEDAQEYTPTNPTEEVTGLSTGTTYSFNVRAENEHGWGPYSDCIFVRVE